MNTNHMQPRAAVKMAVRLVALAVFLCAAPLPLLAATNWVSGIAYGTNDWSNADAIASQTNGSGSLVVGYSGTTNLTLSHSIEGFVNLSSPTNGFKVNATGATLTGSEGAVLSALNATNLVITGGRFIGAASSGTGGSGPDLPGLEGDAIGGYITNSTATVSGSEFAGVDNTAGFVADRSELVVSNGIFRGGDSGTGLLAIHSTVQIHDGSFTGGIGRAAIYLENSDATISNGVFVGNVGGTQAIAGDGLFSILTEATTNHVDLHGGTFSSLAFYGTNDTVQYFLAGTNLVVENVIYQNGGTVIVDNRSNDALQQLSLTNGTMIFGNDVSLGSNGVFTLQSSTMEFGNDFILDSGSELYLYQSQLAAAGNIGFASDSFMGISASTGGYIAITADAATFETNSALFIDASGVVFPEGTNDLDFLVTTNGISVSANGTTTTATTVNFNEYVNLDVTNHWLTIFNGAFIDDNDTLRFQFSGGAWEGVWDTNSQPARLADELQDLDDGTMAAVVSTLDEKTFKTATEETYLTVRNTFQTALHGMQAAVGQSVARGAEFREELKLKPAGSRKGTRLSPAGARGPQQKNDLRGWAKYYGQRYNHDAEGLNPDYEADLDGGVIGIDKSIGGLLLGLAGGYGYYSTTYGGNGEDNIDAYHGALYGTYGMENAYIDAGIAYGFNQVETLTSDPFILAGEFDAQILSAYLGGGIDFVDAAEGMVFTPEASIQYSMYEQDAYSETSDTAVPRNIDAFDADSLRGSLGLNVSIMEKMKLETFSFKYDIRAHWIREFNPDPGNMNFNLEGGSNPYQLTYPMLDEDLYRVGIGCSFFNTKRNQPKNVLFRIDFDELFGDGFNSHNFSAKVVYAF